MKRQKKPKQSSVGRVRRFVAHLGPGLISGAADDDPSGISTFSIAGASFGYMPLWTALFSIPLMITVQSMCARLGLVTGRGLAGSMRKHFPPWVLLGSCALLMVANAFNIGADLGGMGAATQMMTGINSYYWMPFYALLIISLLVFTSYRQIALIFKWLTLVLFAYVAAAFLAHPNWYGVLSATFIPKIHLSSKFLATFVAILGTSISPYLFFWQASQEVEEERAKGRSTVEERKGANDKELRVAQRDVITGMVFSNLIVYFIILTTASTLHAHGKTDIQTARQAAEALRPLAGDGAYLLFTLGLIGTGILAIPVLAGSSAYALSEAMNWRGTLKDRPPSSSRFYAVVGASLLIGLSLDFLHLNAVKMLFYAGVINGVLAPPLIVLVVLLTSKREVMRERTNSPLLRYSGWATAAIMTAAVVGMFVTM